MSKKRLTCFLGLPRSPSDRTKYGYAPTRYSWIQEGRDFEETQFLAVRLAEHFAVDSIHLLATEEAWALLGRASDQAERDGPSLQEALTSAGFHDLVHHEIPKGQGEDTWVLFEQIRRCLMDTEDEVILDVTFGFRVQPFLAAACACFVMACQRPGEPRRLRVVYGVQEPGPEGRGSIWELTPFLDVVTWALGAQLFLRTGRADIIGEATEKVGRTLDKRWSEGDHEDPRPNLTELGKSLTHFGRDLATLRTGALLLGRNGQVSSAKRLLGNIEATRDYLSRHLPALPPILERVVGRIRGLDLEAAEPWLGAAAGRWALARLARLYQDFERHPEAATIVQEALVTGYATGEGAAPGRPGCTWEARDAAKRHFRAAESNLYRDIAGLRNDIDHGGFRDSPAQAEKLIKKLGTWIDVLEERARQETSPPPRPPARPGDRLREIAVQLMAHADELDRAAESEVSAVVGSAVQESRR
ncbi:MAG: TM1812 family CRISPR-associated protein [Acidobacteriota bacterium]